MSPATPSSMQMAHEASLLDDARFLEELAKIEALPTEDTSAFPRPAPTVAESAEPSAVSNELPPALGVRRDGPQFVLAPPPSRRRSPRHSRPNRPVVRIRMSAREDQPPVVNDNATT